MAKIWQHFVFTFLCNLGPLAFGFHMGWLVSFIDKIMDQSSPLYGYILSDNEVSWLGSLLSISMLIGTPMYGLLLQYLSCKPLCLLTNVFHVIAFGLYLVPNIWVAYCARFAAGVASVGSIVVTPLYMNECVEPSYCGVLGALCSLSGTIGVTSIIFVGALVNFSIANCVCLFCIILFFCGYLWLPDPPVWLMMRNRVKEAVISLKKLRSEKNDNVQKQIFYMHEEMEVTRCVKNAGIINVLKDKGFRKALILSSGLMIAQQCTGITSIQLYFPFILTIAQCDVDMTTAILFYGIAQLIGAILGAFFLKFMGRKIILVATNLLITASHIMIWGIAKAHIPSSWLLYTILFFTASYSVGIGTVPFVLLPELLPQAARGVAVATAGLITGVITFLYAKFFLVLLRGTSLATCFATIGCVCFLGTLFIIFCIFETKDKTPTEIYKLLNGMKISSQKATDELAQEPQDHINDT